MPQAAAESLSAVAPSLQEAADYEASQLERRRGWFQVAIGSSTGTVVLLRLAEEMDRSLPPAAVVPAMAIVPLALLAAMAWLLRHPAWSPVFGQPPAKRPGWGAALALALALGAAFLAQAVPLGRGATAAAVAFLFAVVGWIGAARDWPLALAIWAAGFVAAAAAFAWVDHGDLLHLSVGAAAAAYLAAGAFRCAAPRRWLA